MNFNYVNKEQSICSMNCSIVVDYTKCDLTAKDFPPTINIPDTIKLTFQGKWVLAKAYSASNNVFLSTIVDDNSNLH